MVDFEYKEAYNIQDYQKIMALLRSENGCPWDREQDHHSIRRNLLEEAYEVCEAIDEEDPEHLKEELGDLLMQVLFHTQIETEQGRFTLDDVADGACKKLILRHPHVFGTTEVSGSEDVLRNWDEIKLKEKSQDTTTKAMSDVAESLPALWRAEKVQKKAAKVGFDWPTPAGAMMKVREETAELQQAIDLDDRENMEEEIGDLLFSTVNAARLLKIDPEQALHRACEKFIRRFSYMEEHAAADGKSLASMTLDEMETYYQQGRHDLEGKEIADDLQALKTL